MSCLYTWGQEGGAPREGGNAEKCGDDGRFSQREAAVVAHDG